MHGQKRSEYKSRLLHPETSSKLATKAQQWNHLSKELSTQRRRLFRPVGSADEPANNDAAAAASAAASASEPSPAILLALTEKMLSVNPDPSHLWNVRREMLLYAPPASGAAVAAARGDAADDNIAAENADGPRSSVSSANSNNNNNSRRPSSSPPIDIGAELTLTAHCLQRNPKAYSSWFHRKWSLVYYLTHPPPLAPAPAVSQETQTEEKEEGAQEEHLIGTKAILRSELDLCAQFLQMDERNFHCWNHRRFVVGVLGSCGGGGGRPSSSAQEDADIIAETSSDMELLFDGSWSSWTTNRSKLSMGGQLSHDAIDATGNIVPSDDAQSTGDEGTRRCAVAKSISPLSREELDEIIADEWNFTTSKIQDNFSNGSAFHYRSKLLPLILESRLSSSSSDAGGGGSDDDGNGPAERYGAILSLAREEWESMLLNAVFTEPDDQTPWWYHRFILSWTKPSDDTDDGLVEEYEALLFEMADSLRELLEVEKENNDVASSSSGGGSGAAEGKDESKGAKCKWAYIGLHLVLSTLLESKSLEEEEASELREEARECLVELMKIDPNRKERYQNLTAEIREA